MKAKPFLSSIGALLLTGCSLSTPTSKPNANAAEIVADQDYYVVVTHAYIADGLSDRREFFKLTGNVEASLSSAPGIVNFSKRANLLANEAWTLTVWENRAAVEDFKFNRSHIEAMSNADQVLSGARFARFVVKGADLPVSWELALEQLDTQNQGYNTAYGG